MEYFADRGKDAQERTEELIPVIEDLTQAFLDGELAADGFASGMDVVIGALTAEGSEETNKFIDSLNTLGVASADVGQQMLNFESDFDKAATALLKQKGYSDDVVESMLAVVNATDDNGDALRREAEDMKYFGIISADLTEEQLQMLAVLEEIQDQTENLDGPAIASEALLELRRSGDLALEAFDRFSQEIADGASPLDVYARAIEFVRLSQSAGIHEANRYRNSVHDLRREVEEVDLQPLLGDFYVLERALRQIGDAATEVNDELASAEKETKTLTKATDKFVDVLAGVEKTLLEAQMSSEEVTAAQQILAANFYATAAAAGATGPELQKLRDTLTILDGLDPRIDISMGLDASELQRQLRNAETVLQFLDAGVAGVVDPVQRASQQALIDQLKALSIVADAFGSSNSAVGRGVRRTSEEFDKSARSASRLANELDDVADAYREIVQELLSVDFALTNSEVLLEELRDRALEVAKAFDQMSDAKRLQEFHGQIQNILSMMRDLAASGASMSQIDNFVQQLIGPNGALAVFAKSAGISAEDFAKAIATIGGFQFQIGQEQQFAAATAGMTPAEVEQFSKYLLGLEASGAIPTQSYSTASVSAGSTTINVNLPPGVSGVDVVNALQDYAQTSGASVQAPFEFVNLG
jgi:signal recognition particle GTPase